MADGGKLGREKWWEEMTAAEQNHASVLGYDGPSWDEGLYPATCEKAWASLAPNERIAATYLGYTQLAWNAELVEEASLVHQEESARKTLLLYVA